MASGFIATVVGIVMHRSMATKDKLLDDLELQKRAITAKIAGEPFNPKRRPGRAFSQWFFQRRDEWWTHLRVGHTRLWINGSDTFPAGSDLSAVSAWYDQVAEATRAGELDGEIAEALKRRTTGKRKAA